MDDERTAYLEAQETENSAAKVKEKVQTFQKNYVQFYWNQGKQFHTEGENHIPLYCVKFTHSAPKGKILIATGYNESQLKYAEIIKNLFDEGYSVCGYDHRGQGYSQRFPFQKNRGYIDDADFLVRDLGRVYHIAQKDEPQNLPIFILAHSMGAAVATACAQQKLIKPQGLILSAPMYSVRVAEKENIEKLFQVLANIASFAGFEKSYLFGQKDCVPFLDFKGNDLTNSKYRFDAWRKLISEIPEMQLGGVTFGWVKESIKLMHQIRAHPKDLSCPVLFLSTSDDTVVSHQAVVDFAKECPSGELLEFSGPKHELLMEIDFVREEILKRAVQFINKNCEG